MLYIITATGKVSQLAVEDLIRDFMPVTDENYTQDDQEQRVVQRLLLSGLPVYDLSRGLYPVPQDTPQAEMPLDGAVRHAETFSDDSGVIVYGKPAKASPLILDDLLLDWEDRTSLINGIKEDLGMLYRLLDEDKNVLYVGKTYNGLYSRLREHYTKNDTTGNIGPENFNRVRSVESVVLPKDELLVVEAAVIHEHHPPLNKTCNVFGCLFYGHAKGSGSKFTEREISNMHHAIRVKENLHPTTQAYANGTRDLKLEDVPMNAIHPEKIKCYRSATGKVRKAGQSKARPKETEVYLSEEEYRAVSGKR